jgi:uncharacterized protein (TIGR04255 family)
MPRPATQDGFKAFTEQLRGGFPRAQDIRFLAAHLQVDGPDALRNDVSNTLYGVRLEDPEGRWVVQAKSDGLAVSRLPRYESWDELLKTMRSVWPVYVEIFRPDSVPRVGVRYINRIPLPDGGVDLDLVLTAGPRIPPGLPQALAQFVTRVVIPIGPEGAQVAILQSVDITPAGSGVILDIDAWCERGVSPESDVIWTMLQRLREAKNMAFFESLTKPTLESFA